MQLSHTLPGGPSPTVPPSFSGMSVGNDARQLRSKGRYDSFICGSRYWSGVATKVGQPSQRLTAAWLVHCRRRDVFEMRAHTVLQVAARSVDICWSQWKRHSWWNCGTRWNGSRSRTSARYASRTRGTWRFCVDTAPAPSVLSRWLSVTCVASQYRARSISSRDYRQSASCIIALTLIFFSFSFCT